MTHGSYHYCINASNAIEFVNEEFLTFARDNGLPAATASDYVGRNLFDFISGREARQLYEALFEKVRRENRRFSIPFRCDSPTVSRRLRMDLSCLSGGGVSMQVRTESEVVRPAVNILSPSVERSARIAVICSWCKSVRADSAWVPVEDAAIALGLFGDSRPPLLSHGICDACEEVMLATLSEGKARAA